MISSFDRGLETMDTWRFASWTWAPKGWFPPKVMVVWVMRARGSLRRVEAITAFIISDIFNCDATVSSARCTGSVTLFRMRRTWDMRGRWRRYVAGWRRARRWDVNKKVWTVGMEASLWVRVAAGGWRTGLAIRRHIARVCVPGR